MQHTLEHCSAWTEQRSVLTAVVGSDLFLVGLVKTMFTGEEAWLAIWKPCGRRERGREYPLPMMATVGQEPSSGTMSTSLRQAVGVPPWDPSSRLRVSNDNRGPSGRDNVERRVSPTGRLQHRKKGAGSPSPPGVIAVVVIRNRSLPETSYLPDRTAFRLSSSSTRGDSGARRGITKHLPLRDFGERGSRHEIRDDLEK